MLTSRRASAASDLRALLGADRVPDGDLRRWSRDASGARGLTGVADAVVLPRTPAEVAEVVRWCGDHDVPVVPRGGGTGLVGGAVPAGGGVVVALERLRRVRRLEPELWRMEVEAGVTTAGVQRLARENGLLFPPDPGAGEQSQIGGNVATNAGGPHAYGYGTTRRWVTGLEVVTAAGAIVALGGALTKDVAGYDLVGLMAGSEGTLGVITAASLRLVPHPEARLPVAAAYPTVAAGCAALAAVLGSGVRCSAIEFADEVAVQAARGAFPGALPPSPALLLLAEVDGSTAEAAAARDDLADALAPGADAVHLPPGSHEARELWRWREAIPHAVAAVRGGKLSDDVAVPVDRLAEAVEGTTALGARHAVVGCSWGHAGDGNLHATFLVEPGHEGEHARAARASEELLALAVALGGTVSGEHGVGLAKAHAVARRDPDVLALERSVRRALDPAGLLNPGKKTG